MNNITVTNEMLYELFKEFREDFKGFKREVNSRFDQVDKRFEQVDKRFEQIDQRFDLVDKRFEQVDKRFEQVDNRFAQLEDAQSEDRKILRDLWENREKQTLNFSSIYFSITLAASVMAAIATSYIMN